MITGLEKIEPKTKKMADVIVNLGLNAKKQQLLLVTPKAGVDLIMSVEQPEILPVSVLSRQIN